MAKKSVTIEDLAVMVKKGFDSVDKRFDGVDERLDRIEKLILADHKRRIESVGGEKHFFCVPPPAPPFPRCHVPPVAGV